MRAWGSNSRHNYITTPSRRQIMPAQQVLKSDILHPGAETAHRPPVIALALGCMERKLSPRWIPNTGITPLPELESSWVTLPRSLYRQSPHHP